MTHKEESEQALANALKTVRAAVRLRKSIEADNELNDLLPEVELRWNAALQKGKQLSIAEVKRAVGL